MTDRPILFSGPMVRALIAGSKTQTRRAIKQPGLMAPPYFMRATEKGIPVSIDDWGATHYRQLPYQVGDRLYVREHWRTFKSLDVTAPRDMVNADGLDIEYLADGTNRTFGKHRQAMHMPRWASRITLTVTDVRVERLQDISEADAVAEGIELVRETERWGKHWRNYGADGFDDRSAVYSYRTLWNAVNGHTGASPKPAEPWSLNPWVAAYTFTVAMGNIDQLEVA